MLEKKCLRTISSHQSRRQVSHSFGLPTSDSFLVGSIPVSKLLFGAQDLQIQEVLQDLVASAPGS